MARTQASLEGADRRVARAEEHAAELEVQVDAINRYSNYKVTATPDPDQPHIFRFEGTGMPTPSPKWTVLVGETIYNLRAALDYLVYELAWIDSGYRQDGTQFPMDEKPKTFANNRRHASVRDQTPSFLKGLSPSHIDSIRKLQPFAGCTWTRELRDLSNPDKHRELHPTAVEAQTQFDKGTHTDPVTGEERVEITVGGTHKFDVRLEDGRLIVPTLEGLASHVRDAIGSFRGDFSSVSY